MAFLNTVRAPSADPVADELGHRNTADAGPYTGKAAVLALDIGTSMGWALRTGCTVVSGSKSFAQRKGETRGDRLLRFGQWLASMNAGGLGLVAYEDVAFHGKLNGVMAAHAYGQYEGAILTFCARHQIPVRCVHTATLKKAITGKGNAKKPAVIAAVQAHGFRPADDDEADALAVLLWALGTRGSGPLL